MNIGVHVTHCCSVHGCKYGDADCPVAGGIALQQYPCETCEFDSFLDIGEKLAKANDWWDSLTEHQRVIIFYDNRPNSYYNDEEH